MRNTPGRVLVVALLTSATMAACAVGQPPQDASRGPAGSITGAGSVDVAGLQVGDCIDETSVTAGGSVGADVAEVRAVPCSQRHTAEVVGVDATFFEGAQEYPGDAQVSESASDECVGELEAYAAVAYPDGSLDVIALYPTEQSWAQARDRGVACLGITLAEDGGAAVATTGTIRVR